MITDLRKRPAPATVGGARAGGVHPVLALGFRPFFLLAGLLAMLYVPLWLLVIAGVVTLPTQLWPSAWHAHEMVFGFASAVIAGFLLTAVRNWTGRATPSGVLLGALVALWILGRAAILFEGAIPPMTAAAIDVAFLPAVALAIAVPIVRARNWRNLAFVPLVLSLSAMNLLFHFGSPTWAARAPRVAVDVVVLVAAVMGGRVIPSFTANALGVTVRRDAFRDWGAVVATGAVTVLDLVPSAGRIGGIAALVAGVLHGARMIGWHSFATRKQPILWVLHLGYAWIAVGLVLRGLSAFIPQWMASAPTHALTVGAVGTLILGMTARVSLGHTGRVLVVPRPVAVGFALLVLAAIVRAVGPLALPAAYYPELVISGALWTVAFGLFVVCYAPILVSPRVDGKPG